MKLVLRTFFLAALCIVGSVIYGFYDNVGHANNFGSPGARTGSPGNNGATCTGCHSGTASPTADVITSNVPSNGYVPGETYTFSMTISDGNKTKYGFEARHEGADKKSKGTLIITESGRTKQLSSGQNASITHTSGGTAASGNTNTWTWDWIAPATGTGTVTVYAAINATNSNGGTSGDKIFTTNLPVAEADPDGIFEQKSIAIQVYPNPTTDILHFEGALSNVQVFDITGALVEVDIDAENGRVEVQTLPKGIYTIAGKNNGETVVARFVKQ